MQFGSPNGFNAAALLGETNFQCVIVMPAYRVNLFGFLYSAELEQDAAAVGETVGNHGFWDQRLAMEWTKENVHLFGGNPDNITISGYSAGECTYPQRKIFDILTTFFRCKLRIPSIGLRPPSTRRQGHRPSGLHLLQLPSSPTQKYSRDPNPIRPAPRRTQRPLNPLRKREARSSPRPPTQTTPRRSPNHRSPPIPPNNRQRLHPTQSLHIPGQRRLCPQTSRPQRPTHPRRMRRRTLPLQRLVPSQSQYPRCTAHKTHR